MERKIGEIFEYNNEWLQCVEQPKKYDKTVCALCAFRGNGNCELDKCSGTYRSDKKSVIFKKLEKVGEPIIYMSRTFQKLKSPDTYQCKYCYFRNQVCTPQLCGEKLFLVEIKIKENMEEKKLNLKPFDIQKAREGKPVCTRDGRRARIICADAKSEYPVIALVERGDGTEAAISYRLDGRRGDNCLEASDDLVMLSEKKEGWVNVYKNQIHDTPESAEEGHKGTTDYIKTIKVEWEE